MAESMEGCIMLALSKFTRSEQAVESAIERAKSTGKLFVAFVEDDDLAEIFSMDGMSPKIQEKVSADFLKDYKEETQEHVSEIAEKAKLFNITVKSAFRAGNFASVCLDLVNQEKPSLIVITRSHRPDWLKRVFGAPESALVEYAGCPVLVV